MYAPNDSILNTDYTGKYAIWHPTEYHVQKITNGYNLLSYSLYNNDIPVYYEHLTDNVWDTVYWYYPDGQIKYAFCFFQECKIHKIAGKTWRNACFFGSIGCTWTRNLCIQYVFKTENYRITIRHYNHSDSNI